MKLAIVGSREFPDLQMVRDYVDTLDFSVDVFSGGAKGVDATAVDQAKARKMRWKEVKIDSWYRDGQYNSRAGYERNMRLVDMCDCVVAFWDSESGGTKQCFEYAREQGKLLHVFTLQR